MKISAFASFLLISVLSYSQNVGIGTALPSEKLEVNGKVFSNLGGFKFPDGTVQETAATMPPPFSDAANKKSFIVMTMDFVSAGSVPGSDSLLTGVTDGIVILDFDFNNFNFQGLQSKGEFRFVKETDSAGPLIGTGMITNDTFSASFYFVEVTGSGNTAYYQIDVTNGIIQEFKTYIHYLGNGEWAHLEEIKIDYDQLDLTHLSTGTSVSLTF